jgi:TetR/AcrR family transcriptional regulator, transcriptional repressor of aconitase
MPRVTEAYRTARRDEIVEAALRCFAARGYQRTSMADIIEESGLSAGAIYGHFAGKKELFAAVAGRVLDTRLGGLIADRGSGPPPAPGAIMASLLDGIRREPFANVLVQLWGEAAVDPEIRALVQTVIARVRATIRAALLQWASAEPGRVDGDLEEWATRMMPVVVATGPGFLVQRMLIDDFDEEAYLAALPEALPH